MENKQLEDQTNKIEYLKKRCLLIIDFLLKLMDSNELILEVKAVVNALYDKKDLKGLRMTCKDLDDWASHLSKDEYDKLNKILDQELGIEENFEAIRKLETIKKIIKRGHINNNQEYKIILERVDEIYKNESKKDQIEKLNTMLKDYHKKSQENV